MAGMEDIINGLAEYAVANGFLNEADLYSQVGQASADLGTHVARRHTTSRQQRQAQRRRIAEQRYRDNARMAEDTTNGISENNLYAVPTADITTADLADIAGDTLLTGAKAALTAGQGAVGVGNLATGGALDDVYTNISRGNKALDDMYASERLEQGIQNIAAIAQDKDAGIGDVAMSYLENPYAGASELFRNYGSMLLPTGIGGIIGRLAGAANAARAGAILTNAAVNSGDQFSSPEMQQRDLADRYFGAGMSFGTSAATGGIMEGGVQGRIASRMAGQLESNALQEATSPILNAVRTAGRALWTPTKEGLSEIGEDLGGVAANAYLQGRTLNMDDAKQLTASGVMGFGSGLLGSGMDIHQGIQNARAIGQMQQQMETQAQDNQVLQQENQALAQENAVRQEQQQVQAQQHRDQLQAQQIQHQAEQGQIVQAVAETQAQAEAVQAESQAVQEQSQNALLAQQAEHQAQIQETVQQAGQAVAEATQRAEAAEQAVGNIVNAVQQAQEQPVVDQNQPEMNDNAVSEPKVNDKQPSGFIDLFKQQGMSQEQAEAAVKLLSDNGFMPENSAKTGETAVETAENPALQLQPQMMEQEQLQPTVAENATAETSPEPSRQADAITQPPAVNDAESTREPSNGNVPADIPERAEGETPQAQEQPSDALNKEIDDLLQQGVMTQEEAEQARQQFGSSLEKNAAETTETPNPQAQPEGTALPNPENTDNTQEQVPADVDPETGEVLTGSRKNRANPPIPQSSKGNQASAFTFNNSRWDNFTRTVQDYLVDLKRLQEQIQAQGGTITDESNPYRAEEAYTAKLNHERKIYTRQWVRPLVVEAKKAGLDYGQLSQKLYSHMIEGRPSDLPQSIIDKAYELEYHFADMMLKEGLVTPEEHHIMLQNGPVRTYIGERGLDEKNHFGNLLAFGDSVIAQKAKNEVGRALLNLCRDNPGNAWEVTKKDIGFSNEGGQKKAYVPQAYDETIAVRDRNGVLYHIEPKDPVAVNAFRNLKNMDAAQSDKVLEWFGKVNNYFGKWITARNPGFILRNLFRDTQDALFNLSSTPLNGLTHRGQVLKNIPSAMKALHTVLKDGTASGDMGRYAQEFIENGGRTAYLEGLADSNQSWEKRINDALSKIDKDGKEKLGAAAVIVEGIEHMNAIAENAVRLATYATARENGMSIKHAISIARNISVNFNRHGTSRLLSTLYLFGNASIQGTVRLAKACATKQGAAIAGGIVAAGFLNRLIVQMIFGGVNNDDWEKDARISQSEKDNYWIIPTSFGAKADDYIKAPLPHGLKAFHNIGGMLADLAFNDNAKAHWASHILNTLSSITTSFMPTGTMGSWGDAFTPTAFRPVTQLYTNTNGSGGQIAQEVAGDTPKWKADDFTLPWHYKWLSRTISRITGEDEKGKHAGWANISPRHIMHIADSLIMPGLSSDIEKTASMVEKGIQRAFSDPPKNYREQAQRETRGKDLPFIGSFFGSPIHPWESRKIKPTDKGWTVHGGFHDKNAVDAIKAKAETKRMDVSDVPTLRGETWGHSVDGTALPNVIKTIDSAEKTLDVSAYSITHEDVINHLIEAKKRGVEVRIAVDAKQATGKAMTAALNKLEENGIEYRTVSKFNAMHDKFMVADGKHTQTGSFNYTRNAADSNSENATVTWNDESKAESYAHSFDYAWTHGRQGQTYQRITDPKTGKEKTKKKDTGNNPYMQYVTTQEAGTADQPAATNGKSRKAENPYMKYVR